MEFFQLILSLPLSQRKWKAFFIFMNGLKKKINKQDVNEDGSSIAWIILQY